MQLQCVARAVELLGAMADRLSMGAKGADWTSVELQVTQQLLDQGCIDARDGVAREGRSVQLVGARRVEGQQLAFELVRKRGRSVLQYLETFSGKVHQNSIHPIQRGARHQSDVEITHGCGVWLIPPLAVRRRGEYFYWALACWIRSADDSWVRMAAAKRWKAGRAAAETGAAASLCWAMVCGSWC